MMTRTIDKAKVATVRRKPAVAAVHSDSPYAPTSYELAFTTTAFHAVIHAHGCGCARNDMARKDMVAALQNVTLEKIEREPIVAKLLGLSWKITRAQCAQYMPRTATEN